MHLPKLHEEKDWDTIAGFIRQYPFAMLVNVLDGRPEATHLPLELVEKKPGQFVLQGHVARANPQWQAFSAGQALAVFTEPHAYISASWYEKSKIPTWNYIAVHVYGHMALLDEQALHRSLERLMERYEHGREHAARISDIPAAEYKSNLQAIVGFEMALETIQARYKLSQNKNDRDYNSVVQHLEQDTNQQALRIAEAMRKKRPGCPHA
ncbi:MAG TPA: FMN-binding negative transcriptional regulator [Chitinophaga sp.]